MSKSRLAHRLHLRKPVDGKYLLSSSQQPGKQNLYEAGSMPGFCILLVEIAFLTESYIEEADIKNQPGKRSICRRGISYCQCTRKSPKSANVRKLEEAAYQATVILNPPLYPSGQTIRSNVKNGSSRHYRHL